MTIFKPKGSPYWHFRICHQGMEYQATTKTTGRQEAEAIAHKKAKSLGLLLVPRSRRTVRSGRPAKPPRSDRYRGLCHCGQHAWSVLSKGHVVLVSPEDAKFLEAANWYVIGPYNKRLFYAVRSANGKTVRLHRVILGEPASDIDHKDHVGTNNRRNNLRPCSQIQNGGNARPHRGSSIFRGVYLHKKLGRWCAHVAGQHLGVFDTPEEAARAYDTAAFGRWGEFATQNLPQAQREPDDPEPAQ